MNGNDASYSPANVSRQRRHGVAELPRNMTDWKNRNDDKNSNNIKKANTQKSCLSKFKRRYHSTTSLNARLASSAQSANYEPTEPANDHPEKSSAINEKCLSLSLTDLANAKCSTEQTTIRMNILDKKKLSFEDFDIVGESFEARFPWQRDIAIQCNMLKLDQNRHKVGDKNMNLSASKSSHCNHNAKNVSFELETERKQRPRSISTVENAYLTHKADQMRRRNKTRKHMSDPFPNRNFNHLSRKPQTILQEEFGSISDLESIWEDPCDNS